MIEKIPRINNPLTAIAIFAGLAEVAGSVALTFLDPSVQGMFIWFVMLFPASLVALFFITLNFNPRVLYAPSDFKDDENFLLALTGSREVNSQFDVVQQQLGRLHEWLIENVPQVAGSSGQGQKEAMQAIESQLEVISEKLAATRQTADSYVIGPYSLLQNTLLQYVPSRTDGADLSEISAATGMSGAASARMVDRLKKRGALEQVGAGRTIRYRASNPLGTQPN